MRSGGSNRRCIVDVGGILIAIEAPDDRLAVAMSQMFRDIAGPDGLPDAVIEVRSATHGFEVGQAGDPAKPFMTASQVMREVVRLVNRIALDHDRGRLHLHGALVAVDGRGLLLSAPSGTGKTTTTAALVLGGAVYVSDETTSIDHDAAELRGFPKPLTIRRGAAALLPEIESGAVRVDEGSAPPWIVPVSSLGAGFGRSTSPFMVAVLERPVDDNDACEPSIEPMDRADACVALIQESLDFDRFGAGSLEAVARLCARSHCVRVRLGSPALTAEALRDAVRGAGGPSMVAVSSGDTGDTMTSTGSLTVGAAVRWVAVDGAVVLHHRRSKVAVSLHGDGGAWWLELLHGGPSRVGDIDAGLVELLETHEFVRRQS